MSSIIPIPKCTVSIRPATMEDFASIDGLQKPQTRNLGWMPTQQLQGKIKLGQVIIAEDEAKRFLGYCIGQDQYFKRDDLGIIYQLSVVPEMRRSLVAATLIKAMFDRAAYGCRLFCCWCAQDLEANRFWEALGFVPLAFRTGVRSRKRVHIFWQRRIREGDETTPYWFPSKTSGGTINEDRIVLPIPPGKKWSDEMPVVLPTDESTKLHDPQAGSPNNKQISTSKSKVQNNRPLQPTQRRVQFGRPMANPQPPPAAKKEKPKRQKVKNDPKLVAAARELRDRWLEHANAHPEALQGGSQGKYDVSRALIREPHIEREPRQIAA